MAKLTAKARAKIPASKFAGPGRSYPVNDKNHARAALSMLHNAPKSEQPAIHAKAEAVLHKAGGGAVDSIGEPVHCDGPTGGCSTPFPW